MDIEAEKALAESEAHWIRMRDDPDGCLARSETPNGRSCELCTRFQRITNCTGCPVHTVTDQHMCDGTPWQEATRMWKRYFGFGFFFEKYGRVSLGALQTAFDLEIEFLRSCREESVDDSNRDGGDDPEDEPTGLPVDVSGDGVCGTGG